MTHYGGAITIKKLLATLGLSALLACSPINPNQVPILKDDNQVTTVSVPRPERSQFDRLMDLPKANFDNAVSDMIRRDEFHDFIDSLTEEQEDLFFIKVDQFVTQHEKDEACDYLTTVYNDEFILENGTFSTISDYYPGSTFPDLLNEDSFLIPYLYGRNTDDIFVVIPWGLYLVSGKWTVLNDDLKLDTAKSGQTEFGTCQYVDVNDHNIFRIDNGSAVLVNDGEIESLYIYP